MKMVNICSILITIKMFVVKNQTLMCNHINTSTEIQNTEACTLSTAENILLRNTSTLFFVK